jgi:hypothetical protein
MANNHNKVAIFSDSLSSLVSLNSNKSKSRPELLHEIIFLYNECLNAGKEVTIVWCPAHIGVFGNEQADRAAKAGLGLKHVTESISLSPTEVYSIIRKHIMSKWQNSINSQDNNIKHVKNTVGLTRPINYSSDRRVDIIITRLRVGTTLLPGSVGQHIKNIDPKCPQCRVKFDSYHLLFDCCQFMVNRNTMIDSFQKAGLGFTYQNVLNPPKSKNKVIFSALEKFLLDCKLTDQI